MSGSEPTADDLARIDHPLHSSDDSEFQSGAQTKDCRVFKGMTAGSGRQRGASAGVNEVLEIRLRVLPSRIRYL